jgi:hypothetical protein
MDKQQVSSLRTEAQAALNKVAKKYGVTLPMGTITHGSESIRFSVKGMVGVSKKMAGDPLAAAYSKFEARCGKKLGDTIRIFGKTLKIVGAKPSNRKYPILVQGVQGGSYKVSVQQVKDAL